jgi:hypothetical protein
MKTILILAVLVFCCPVLAGHGDKDDHDRDRCRDKVVVREHRGCEKVIVREHHDRVVVVEERRRHHHHYREEYREGRPVVVEREVYRDPEPVYNPTLQFVVPVPTPPTVIITPGRH